MTKYIRIPVEVEAVQWTGSNLDEVKAMWPDVYSEVLCMRQLTVGENRVMVLPGKWAVEVSPGRVWDFSDAEFRATYRAVEESK